MPSSTIYIRTYTKDLPWFKWAMASIAKFWAETSHVLINCEPSDVAAVNAIIAEFPVPSVQISPWVQWGNDKGYLFQQWAKLTADRLCDSDIIVFFDSDLLLNRVTSLEDFMDPERKRIRVFYEPYPSVEITEPGAASWLKPTWRAMQVKPEWEFMRRHPFVFWRETIQGCREYLEGIHGPLHEWLINLGTGTEQVFSEFNCLGFYAWLHETDRYWFLNVKEYERFAGTKYGPQLLSENPVEQFHSWTGDPEQAHYRFLQACEKADHLVKVAQAAQAETEKKIEEYVAKKDQEQDEPSAHNGQSEKEPEELPVQRGSHAMAAIERTGDEEPTKLPESVSIDRNGETVVARVGDQLHVGIDPAYEGQDRSSIQSVNAESDANPLPPAESV